MDTASVAPGPLLFGNIFTSVAEEENKTDKRTSFLADGEDTPLANN
jgi:hypothetical protein